MTREEAIALLRGDAFKFCAVDLCEQSCEDCYEALYMAKEALEREPKRGKWKQAEDVEKEYAVCTNCKHHGEFYMDYCPNCGAKMESDTE